MNGAQNTEITMRSARRRSYRARAAAARGSFTRVSAVQAVVADPTGEFAAIAIPRRPRLTALGWTEPDRGLAFPHLNRDGAWSR